MSSLTPSGSSPTPLSALTALTDIELERRHEEAWNRLRAVKADVSSARVADLLSAAVEFRAVHAHGIVLRVPDTTLRVVVDLVDVHGDGKHALLFSLLSESGEEVLAAEWSEGSVASLMADLEQEIDYQEDRPTFDLDATALFTRFIETVQVGFEARFGTAAPSDLTRGFGLGAVPVDLFPIVELGAGGWAVTTAGVENLTKSFLVQPAEFADATALAMAEGFDTTGLEETVAEAMVVLPWFSLMETE